MIKKFEQYNSELSKRIDNIPIWLVNVEKINEHIHYLMDDYEDKDEEENDIMEVVALPSGFYFTIDRKKYTEKLMRYITWSEKLKMYVCRDKDLNRIEWTLAEEGIPF